MLTPRIALGVLMSLLTGAGGCVTLPLPAEPAGHTGRPSSSGLARSSAGAPGPELRFSHKAWGRFLRAHVDAEGFVDYRAANANRGDLDRYIRRLVATSPETTPEAFPNPADRLAYWLNAYNAWVVYAVLEAYPIASVNDVKPPRALFALPQGAGFFLLQRISLGGRPTSLYALENRVIRKRFAEPRVHFALNCASHGCPRLPSTAFTGDRLELQLERETRRFLAQSRNLEIEPATGSVRLSSIFRWYRRDFIDSAQRGPGVWDEPLLDFVAPFLDEGRRAALHRCGSCRIQWISYDWSLNDASADLRNTP